MGFAEDFTELLTNPGLIAGAIGAVAPEEAKIGGQWWRVAPKVKALSNVLLAARQGAEDTSAGQEMANLAKPMGTQPQMPWPPSAPGDTSAAAPTATSRVMLPPGSTRAQMVSQLTPEMFRYMGRNRLGALNLDTVLDAAQGQAKDYQQAEQKKALYDAYYAGLSKAYPPDVADKMARSRAEMLQPVSEGFIEKPPAARQTEALQADVGLQKAQQSQAFTQEASKLDPNNYQQMVAFRQRARELYPYVPFEQAFAGNRTAQLAFNRQELDQINKDAIKGGMQYWAEIGPDGGVKLAPHEFKGGPEDAQQMALAGIQTTQKLVSMGVMDPQSAAAFQMQLQMAGKAGNVNQVIELLKDSNALWRTYIHANEARKLQTDVLSKQEYMGQMKELQDLYQDIERNLQTNPRFAGLGTSEDPAHWIKTRGAVAAQDYQAEKIKQKLVTAAMREAYATTTPQELRYLVGQVKAKLAEVQGGTDRYMLSAPPVGTK